MASRSLDDLAATVKARALAFVTECNRLHLDVLIYCTLRSCAEQATLYAMGRTTPGKIITCARAGESRHNPDAEGKAWAFDAVPLMAGKPLWNDTGALLVMGKAGERAGLVWAGRWSGKLRESVHFQG